MTHRHLLLGVALLVALLTPFYFASAQNVPVTVARVNGTLDRQFDRHYLTLRVANPRRPVRLVMDYVPQGQQELDRRSGFFIFDPVGLAEYTGGAEPGALAVAAGDRLPGEGRRLQAIIERPGRDVFYVVVYNDSPVPMNYTLNLENGTFADEGGQVVDVYNPPPSNQGLPPLVVVPGPSPTPTETPRPLRVKSVVGVLDSIYDSDYYELVVLDTGRPVQIEMTYDPPEQFHQDKGFEVNVFSEDQFRYMTNNFILPWRAPDTTEGHLLITDDGRYIWQAEIVEPYKRYIVVVSQWRYALKWLSYRLTVENAAFLVERPPTPTPTSPGPAVLRPGPFVVVTVQKKPTPPLTPTPGTISPLPTPDGQSPLPTVAALPMPDNAVAAVQTPTPAIFSAAQRAEMPVGGSFLYLPLLQRP